MGGIGPLCELQQQLEQVGPPNHRRHLLLGAMGATVAVGAEPWLFGVALVEELAVRVVVVEQAPSPGRPVGKVRTGSVELNGVLKVLLAKEGDGQVLPLLVQI